MEEMKSPTRTMNIPGYDIETLVAQGGMASVFLAVEALSGRRVALKVLEPSRAGTPKYLERFLTEALVTLSLRHPNVVAVYQAGRAGDTYYTTMEYLEGGNLRRPITEGMSPADALGLVETTARCLHASHRAGIIHGDIQPGNILFRGDGTPVLTDFGVSVRLSGHLPPSEGALGTPDYVSPEVVLEEAVDGRSDIYSLGVVLYEMLTGESPYHGDSDTTTTMNHLNEPVPALPPHLAGLQPLVNRMLAYRPEERFQDASALAAYVRTLRQSGLLSGEGRLLS